MKILITITLTLLLLLTACTQTEVTMTQGDVPTETPTETSTTKVGWQDVQLTDVNTGKTFKISDFSDKPVLIESFAVWCPTCTKQQNIMKKFHQDVGDTVVSVSLDTDPNEDVDKVKSHTIKHGFDWKYAVSPKELTQNLIDEFSVNVVNAPAAPIVLVCPDGKAKLLAKGVKSVEDLKEAVAC